MDSKLHILQHSLGLDEYGQGNSYRNHFVTGPGSHDYPLCVALVADGLMHDSGKSVLTGCSNCFVVTKKGMAHVAEHSPKPPKLTQGQKRYQQWLDLDCCESFGTFLKKQWYKI